MNKILLLVLLSSVILSITLVTALQVSFTPTSIVTEIKQGETICRDVIFSIGNSKVAVSDNLNKNLILKYPKEANGKLKVCFKGKKKGLYDGMLYLSQKTKDNFKARAGIYVRINVV